MEFDLDRINRRRADRDRPRVSRDQARHALGSSAAGRMAQAAGPSAIERFLIDLALPGDKTGTAAVDAALGAPADDATSNDAGDADKPA